MNKRTITGIAWAISSCVFLWLFSITQPASISSPPKIDELFNSFVMFSFMLLGGGGCYHLLTEILSSPYDQSNYLKWSCLYLKMIGLMVCLISAPIVIVICREFLQAGLAKPISLVYLITSFAISFWFLTKVQPIFLEIRSNNSIQPTADASAD